MRSVCLVIQLGDEEEVCELEVEVDEEGPQGSQKKGKKEEGQCLVELGHGGEKDLGKEEVEERKVIQRTCWDQREV